MSLPAIWRRAARAHRQEIAAIERQAIGRHARGEGQQAHDGEHGDRFARTGFADDRQNLVGLDRQIDAVDRFEGARRGWRRRPKDCGFRAEASVQLRRIFGSSASRKPSPVRLIATTVIEDGEAGKGDDPRVRANEFPGIGEHRSPFRRRRLRAEAEEAERRGLEDRVGDAERGLHDQRRQAIGQDGEEHQAEQADADDARGGHVILAQFAKRRGAHQPDIAGEIDDRHRDDRVGRGSGPSTATTRMARTRLGTDMMRSITRVIATSTTGPTSR